MPLIHDVLDPVLEGLADDGVDDVDDVASWQRHPLPLEHWQRPHHRRVVCGKRQEALDGQALEERDRHVLQALLYDPIPVS